MVSKINGLISLDQVLHPTAVPLRRLRSTSGHSFTLILHSRFRSKPDLASYAVDPTHLNVIKETAPPADDMLAVNWSAADLLGPATPSPGKERKSEILEAIRRIKNELGGKVIQFSYGKNFSLERFKGFSIAFLAVFPSLREMDSADLNKKRRS